MTKYKVQIIYHIRCTCKSWIPKFHDGKGKFPDLVECPKCHTQWKPSQLVEPPICAMMEEKIFDSEYLLIQQIEYAVKKRGMEKEQANEYAISIVRKQQKIFEEKYGIQIGVQQTLG